MLIERKEMLSYQQFQRIYWNPSISVIQQLSYVKNLENMDVPIYIGGKTRFANNDCKMKEKK